MSCISHIVKFNILIIIFVFSRSQPISQLPYPLPFIHISVTRNFKKISMAMLITLLYNSRMTPSFSKSIVVKHETPTRAEGCNHVDLVWKTTTRHRQDHTPTTTKGWRFAFMPPCASRNIGGSRQGHPPFTDARKGRPWVAHNTIHSATNVHNQKDRHHCLQQRTKNSIFLQRQGKLLNATVVILHACTNPTHGFHY